MSVWTLDVFRWLGTACATLLAFSACGDEQERISCDDLLPATEARFSQIEELVLSSDKGCADADCHSSETAEHGYRLDEPALIYEEFTSRIDSMYAQVASGAMPEGGRRWSEEDLRIVRTWYCNGASPNE